MNQRICPLAENAQRYPNAKAIITDEKIWTYQELNYAVQHVCHFLKERKICSQEIVGFVAHYHVRTLIFFCALMRMQVIAFPLSFRASASSIHCLLHKLKAKYFNLETIPLKTTATQGFSTIDETLLATFLLTSGSSGKPKIACHTLNNYYKSAEGISSHLFLEDHSRWLLSLPLFHVSGLSIIFRMFQVRGVSALSTLPLLQAIQTHAITHVSLVPTQLYRLLQKPDLRPLLHLKGFLLGGAPCNHDLHQQALALDLPFFISYGLTEMSSAVTIAKRPQINHTGDVLPFRECTLSKEGEILVKGPTLFSGYWNETHGIPYCPLENNWFRTGDKGFFDHHGHLHIIGRLDRLIISGGENIHPEEIEDALYTIKGITKAAVVPIRDREFGERPVAFIEDTTGKHTINSIKLALSSLLPSFKHPTHLFPFPNSIHLKIDYAFLREVAEKVIFSNSCK